MAKAKETSEVRLITTLLINIIWFITSLAVLGLALRFALRLFNANTSADFTRFIYDSTAPLLEPFRTIFQPAVIESGSVFEYSTLFAIIIYMLVAWLIVELIEIITYRGSEYRG